MAYIGAPPQNRVLSSDDIAQGAVTLNDINFTDQPTNMDITGVIDKHTMRLADGVTITGDVTISDDLVLSKISDDGNAITMTNDGSSRTITGSGSIEASTLSQTPNQSLTGMTGDIGSAVTGGGGLTSIGTATDGSSLTSLGVVTTGTFNGTLDSTTFSGDAGQRTAKAWVHFSNTAGNNLILENDFNISSVADTATGTVTINFLTDMPNTKYTWASQAQYGGGTNDVNVIQAQFADQLVGSLKVFLKSCINDSTTFGIQEFNYGMVTIFGD